MAVAAPRSHEDIAALAEYHWGKWEAAIKARDDVALGALERLLEGMAGVTVDGIPTERQLDVVQLLAQGCTEAAAAARLGIAHETVKSHIKSIKATLQARTLPQIVAICWRAGWID